MGGEWRKLNVLQLIICGSFSAHMLYRCLATAVVLSDEYRRIHSAGLSADRSGLHPGWLPRWDGEPPVIDVKDGQYSEFRGHLQLLVFGLALFVLGAASVRSVDQVCINFRDGNVKSHHGPSATWVVWYYVLCGLLLLVAAHGSDIGYPLVLIGINYALSELCANRECGEIGVALTWLFGCGTLLHSARYNGWGPFLFSELPVVGRLLSRIDEIPALCPWHHRYPLLVLRMISFNMDRHWATRCGVASPFLLGAVPPPSIEPTSLPNWAWMPQTYAAYLLYPPLYIAGPIMTFNSFVCCVAGHQLRDITPKAKMKACCQAVSALIVYEVFLHYVYIGGISRSPRMMRRVIDDHLASAGFALAVVLGLYLKFLGLWRFFRMWAILDGVVPPDNLPRCIMTTTSLTGFWRTWHSSFNMWLVRYLYLPLGGNMSHHRGSDLDPVTARVWTFFRKVLNVALVFVFVGAWHDQTLSLLAWSVLIVVAIIPELVIKAVITATARGKQLQAQWYYRHVVAIGAAYAIATLAVANIVGFAVGPDDGLGIASSAFAVSGSNWGKRVIILCHIYALAQVNLDVYLY